MIHPTPIKDWVNDESGGFYIVLAISAGIGIGCALIAAIIFIVPYKCPQKCLCFECKEGKSSLVERFVESQVERKNRLEKENAILKKEKDSLQTSLTIATTENTKLARELDAMKVSVQQQTNVDMENQMADSASGEEAASKDKKGA